MKPSTTTLSSFVLLTLAAPLAVLALSSSAAQEKRPDGPPQGKERGHEEGGGDLEQSMQALQGGTKRLDKAFGAKDATVILKTLVDMQHAALDAKVGTPATAAAAGDEAKQKEFVTGFRKQIVELERALLDVEVAVLDGKIEDAKKIYDEKIKPMKKTGHDKYKGD